MPGQLAEQKIISTGPCTEFFCPDAASNPGGKVWSGGGRLSYRSYSANLIVIAVSQGEVERLGKHIHYSRLTAQPAKSRYGLKYETC